MAVACKLLVVRLQDFECVDIDDQSHLVPHLLAYLSCKLLRYEDHFAFRVVDDVCHAQIKQIEAGVKATEVNLLLGLNGVLDNETVIQLICEQLDIDYNEIKDKLPEQEMAETEDAMQMLDEEDAVSEEMEGMLEGEAETQQAVLDMLDDLLKELD